MRAVVQRVSAASVRVDSRLIASIERGIVVFAGIAHGDTRADIDYIVRKCLDLRIFEGCDGKMDKSVRELGLQTLVVSEFTLLGDVRHGRRPNYYGAGSVERARIVFEDLSETFKREGIKVEFGQFQAHMEVSLVNDGPVTILLDSRKEF